MIPVLYNKDEQQFRTYGLGEISDIINPKVTRERNGQYLLYFQYPQNAEFSEIFEEDMRIKSDAGVRTKWQTFEISRVVRKEGQLIEVFAKHISQSLLKDALNPNINIRSSSAQQALRTWNSNRIGDEEFDVWSDISTTSSTSWNIQDVSNAFEALAGVQGSILDVWGGEYEFDNKMIRLHKEMGRKSPVPLEYGRNITGLEQDKQEDNVYTSIYPFAIYTPESGDDPKTVTLPERYIDGKYLEMHNKRKIQVVDFSGEFEHDEVPTASRLKTLAKQYLEANEIGLPHENLKVEYIDLSKTLDYQDFKTMEEVELNDRLPIFYPKFGITNENAKVVVINYDPVKEENISIELGVIGQTFKTITTGGIDSRLDKVEQQQKETTNYIINAKGNRIWFETPDENMEHKIGDTWFEKKGPYDRIRVWNGSQWETIIDSEDIDKNAKAIEAAQADIAQVQQTADEAVNRINGEIAGKFTDIDTEISQVHNDAQNALNQAGDAVSQVAYFGETLDGFTQTVANIDGRVANIRHDVDGITETVTDHTGKIATVEQNVHGIQQTVSDPVNGLVTQVSTLANGFNVLAKDFEDLEVGGRNLIRNSNRFNFTPRGGMNLVVDNDADLVVEEWGATNATKIRLVGGLNSTSLLKATLHDYSYNPYVVGETYTFSFFIRNDRDANVPIIIELNAFTDYEPVRIEGGESKKVVITAKKTNNAFPQVRFNAQRIVNNLEFTIWGYKVEKGNVATDWSPAPEDMATQAQLSVLNDNINLRVEKGDVLGQINIEAGTTLIQNDKLYLDAQSVVFSGKAFIPGAVIEDLSADKITTGTFDAAKARIINLDFDTAVGNRTEFVQSAWNNAVGGNVSISGSGIVTTASNGAQGLIQNGVFLSRRPNGSTLGYIGYGQKSSSGSPYYTINLSHGAHFRVRNHLGSENYQTTFHINSSAEYAEFNVNRVHYRKQITISNHSILAETSDKLVLNGNRSVDMRASNQTVLTISARSGTGYASMYANLDMKGYHIKNAGSYGTRSERKYKSNIIPINNALEIVEQMKFYEYDKNDIHELGIITDEAPECVLDKEKKTVNLYSYTSLIGKSNQELIKRVKELETEVAELKGLIA